MLINQNSSLVACVDAGLWSGHPVESYLVGNRVGESPCWHPNQQCLYWVDIRGQQLLRLRPESRTVDRWDLPEVVGAMALCAGEDVCLALRHRLVKLNVITGQMRDFAIVKTEPTFNRLNDGKVSPSGRWFVFGSMDDRAEKSPSGALYCASTNGDVRQLHTGLTVCNGIAWNMQATQIYFSDSNRGALFRAPWNDAQGQMGQVEVFATLDEHAGRPDGGVVDYNDHYWSAGVSAGCLNVLDNAGKISQKIALPCRAPTMCAFGGSNGNVLYVTSLIRPQWDAVGTHDGAVLAIALNRPGPPAVLFGPVVAD
jgi:sugar lactone lactonase YvrE